MCVMLGDVQCEGYGGHGYGVRKGKVCDVGRCAVGRLWGHAYGVREGKVGVCDVERCAVGKLWGSWVFFFFFFFLNHLLVYSMFHYWLVILHAFFLHLVQCYISYKQVNVLKLVYQNLWS
jgi:hypothetical protein